MPRIIEQFTELLYYNREQLLLVLLQITSLVLTKVPPKRKQESLGETFYSKINYCQSCVLVVTGYITRYSFRRFSGASAFPNPDRDVDQSELERRCEAGALAELHGTTVQAHALGRSY